MPKKRGTSDAPMILGIIGGVLAFPFAGLSFIFVASGTFYALETLESFKLDAEMLILLIPIVILILPIIGMIAGILSKRAPKRCGIIMIICGLLYILTLFLANIGAIITTILFLIGGSLSLGQKTKIVQE